MCVALPVPSQAEPTGAAASVSIFRMGLALGRMGHVVLLIFNCHQNLHAICCAVVVDQSYLIALQGWSSTFYSFICGRFWLLRQWPPGRDGLRCSHGANAKRLHKLRILRVFWRLLPARCAAITHPCVAC